MASRETQAVRLERMEEKIDKLSEAMISLARAEEKLIAIEKNNHANYDRMNRFSEKLDDIEKKVDDNANTVAVINRLFWVALTTVSAAIAGSYWM